MEKKHLGICYIPRDNTPANLVAVEPIQIIIVISKRFVRVACIHTGDQKNNDFDSKVGEMVQEIVGAFGWFRSTKDVYLDTKCRENGLVSIVPYRNGQELTETPFKKVNAAILSLKNVKSVYNENRTVMLNVTTTIRQ